MSEIENLLRSVLNESKDVRTQAEQTINGLLASSPDSLA
jgi:hypothetical protein